MQLEQKLYAPVVQESVHREVVYSVTDLESLSASPLYAFGSGPLGGFSSRPLGGGSLGSRPLTIRDFPSSGFQLHIHEGPGGTAHIRTYKREKILLSSYDAAMADLVADYLKLNKILGGSNNDDKE